MVLTEKKICLKNLTSGILTTQMLHGMGRLTNIFFLEKNGIHGTNGIFAYMKIIKKINQM